MILAILRVGTYVTELYLMRAWALVRRLPVDPLPNYTPQQKTRLNSVLLTLWKDWRRVTRSHKRVDRFPRIALHLRRYFSILGDLPEFLRRKRAERSEDLSHLPTDPRYPAYYLKNYHYQTDGYFSEASALRYDHQIELLFLGMGHMLRKVGYDLLKPHLTPGDSVLEFGAGTGTSGEQFKLLYPEARLTLLDLSPHYLAFAGKTYPASFESGVTCAIEALDVEAEYDCVFSCFTMHEIPRVHWDQACARILRALKPGGVLLLVDSQQDKDGESNRFALDMFQKDFFEPYFQEYRTDDLEAQLERSGFKVLASQPVMFSKAVLARKP